MRQFAHLEDTGGFLTYTSFFQVWFDSKYFLINKVTKKITHSNISSTLIFYQLHLRWAWKGHPCIFAVLVLATNVSIVLRYKSEWRGSTRKETLFKWHIDSRLFSHLSDVIQGRAGDGRFLKQFRNNRRKKYISKRGNWFQSRNFSGI